MVRFRCARAVALIAFLLGCGLVLAGCHSTSSSCVSGSCHVKASVDAGGTTTVDVQGTSVTISDITGTSAAVAIGGSRATIDTGRSASVSGHQVTLNSVSEGQVDLTITEVTTTQAPATMPGGCMHRFPCH